MTLATQGRGTHKLDFQLLVQEDAFEGSDRNGDVIPYADFLLFLQFKLNASSLNDAILVSLLKPTGYVMHQQFNIQQLYALPTLYLCVVYLSENSDLCHLQHKLIGFITEMKSVYCAVRTGSLNKAVSASTVKG